MVPFASASAYERPARPTSSTGKHLQPKVVVFVRLELCVATVGAYDIELRRWPKEADGTISGTLPDGTGKALPITQASLYITGHNHMSIGEKSAYSFEGLTRNVRKEDKGVTFTMNLKKGPTALHTWFSGKDNTMLSAYYVYVYRKD